MSIKNGKRCLFSVFLALTLLLTAQPATVLAADGDDTSLFNNSLDISQGNSSQNFPVNFEEGKAYVITAEWDEIPVFSGSLTGWSLQTASGENTVADGDLIIKTSKKQSTSGVGNSVQTYTGFFIPAQDMSELCLNIQGLVTANRITLKVERAEKEENLLLDATISVDSGMEYISAYFDVNFETGKTYDINASWSQAPSFTDANENKTAWKVQAAQDSNVAGDDDIIYKITASVNTAPQGYSGIYSCSVDKPVFNFFAQRLNSNNQMHLRIECGEPLSFQSDNVDYNKLFNVPTHSNGNFMQGFDIYHDTLFQCYDTGDCSTYDFVTGVKIASFKLGSSYSTNHCGNANFGLEYPSGNTEFPALYVSGDLTTKACYVENVTANSAELIQTIYFDISPSYTGGQVIIDKERGRILYMQRQNPNIRDIYNVFQIFEFRIPALSEGTEIRFTNSDIIGEPYQLSYYSPLYQGATVYQGQLLQSHGLIANSFGSMVGLMNFNINTHVFERHFDLTGRLNLEPQGVVVYQNRLIMNFSNGGIYEIRLDLGISQDTYQIPYTDEEAVFKSRISEEVESRLPEGFSVESVELEEGFELTGENQAFTADVVVCTPYNKQKEQITGSVII